jgi:hypothetical protein
VLRDLSNAGGVWVSTPQNMGSAKAWGIELESRFSLPTHQAIEVRTNLTRNWSRVAGIPGPDNRLDRQEKISGSVGIEYSLAPVSFGMSYSFGTGGWIRRSPQLRERFAPRQTLPVSRSWKPNQATSSGCQQQTRFARTFQAKGNTLTLQVHH